MSKRDTPRWADRFFSWICREARLEDLQGDLYELFDRDIQRFGPRRAKAQYLLNMISLMRLSVLRNILIRQDNMDTIKHYLRSAFRSMDRQKGFSLVSLAGLVTAFTVTILVGIYVHNELGYDQWREDSDRLFRVYDLSTHDDGRTDLLPIVPPVFAEELRQRFPDVESAGRILYDYSGSYFKVGSDRGFEADHGLFIEPQIVELLGLQIEQGSFMGLDEPNKLLLSSTLFEKFFGGEIFDNQVITVAGNEVQIIGIYRDIPPNSHLRPSYLFSFPTAVANVTEERMNSWVWQQFYTYVKLKKGVNPDDFAQRFQAHIRENAHPVTSQLNFSYLPYLQPITDIHLHSSSFQWDIADRGNYQGLIFILLAAVIILVIALFNFVNLFAVQTIRKLREISIRRTVGAVSSQITTQLLVYTGVHIFMGLALAVLAAYFLQPSLESFLGKELDPSFLYQPTMLLACILSVAGVILVSTLYPIVLSRKFKPADTIKGMPRIATGRMDPKMLLVGIQYVLGIGLIFITLVVQQQFNLLRETDMGFDPDRLVSFNIPSRIVQSAAAVKSELLKHSNIEDVSIYYGTPGGIVAGDGVILPERDNQVTPCNMIIVDRDYIRTFGMDVIAGRDFVDSEADRLSAFMINETAVSNFGFESAEDAVGKELEWVYWGYEDSLKRGRIVGVVRDFNFKSLHNTIAPVVLHMEPQYQSYMVVRMGGGAIPETLNYLEDWWREAGSDRPLPYEFVDELFAREYRSEQQLSSLFSSLTLVAMLMAATGIFSLVSYNVNTRIKEISIRKVLGAGTAVIFSRLVSRYMALSVLALTISLPLAAILMSYWLADYPYRVVIGSGSYLAVILVTLLFTLFTVGGQALKAARRNPVLNLRTE